MEKWDLYDLDRQLTGEIGIRDEKLPEDRFHLVVHVCIFNSRGQMLIQQRQPFKKGYPNLWDVSIGGSAVMGDTSRRAAERELLEELGLSISIGERKPDLTIPFSHGFDDWYVIRGEYDLNELTLQPEEVQAAKWADEAEILAMIDDGLFIPYRKPLIPLLYDIYSGGEGAHHPKTEGETRKERE